MFVDEGTLKRFIERPPGPRLDASRPGRPRLAVYSHDAQGLGHLRRNLLITRAIISAGVSPSVVMLSGLREAASYEFPPGVDSITLPALAKGQDGSYTPRSLPLAITQVMDIRRSIITSATAALRPDAFLVDKLPLGIFGELEPALAGLRRDGTTRIVLGLRDILDDAERVRDEWRRGRYLDAVRRYYDEIWVYGDPRVCDVAREYRFPADVASMVRYVGYLNPRDVGEIPEATQPQSAHTLPRNMDLPEGSLTLCLVGGGRDGVELATAFMQAPLPPGHGGVLVCGPLMDAEDRARLRAIGAGRRDVRIIEFITDPQPLMCCADRVICMGGYNTVCEVLAFHKPALVVPRVRPRLEQSIRAERFAALGLIETLHPGDVSGASLSAWIASGPIARKPAESEIDFGGVRALPSMLASALDARLTPQPGAQAHV